MPASRKAAPRTYEVLVSFSALNKGDRFTDHVEVFGDDQWAQKHVETGYLRDVTEEVQDAGQGDVGKG